MIPDWVASTVTQVLEQNMLYGTGTGAHVPNHTDAGKSGTTDNYADAWFNGYTPRLQAAVWIGYPSAEIPMLNVHGIAVSGPTFPAQIWHLYMETAIGSRPGRAVPAPADDAGVDVVAGPVPVQRRLRRDEHERDDGGRDDEGGIDDAVDAHDDGVDVPTTPVTTVLPPPSTETQTTVPPPTAPTGTQP